ncbi:hypothetical protein MMC30_004337 [Trapelia coarctata]|nr:hypothetical protein [Trapelia coarctata]
MEQHSSLEVGTINELEQTQSRKPKRYPRKKPAVDVNSDKLLLPIGSGPKVAGLPKHSHKHRLSNAPQPSQNPEYTQKLIAETSFGDTPKEESAKPSKWKVQRMKRKAKAELLKSQQQDQGDNANQPMTASQTPRSLEIRNSSAPPLEKPVHTKGVVEPEAIVGNTAAKTVAVKGTDKPTKRGPYKPHRKQRVNGQGYDGSRGNGSSKAGNGPSEPKQAQLDLGANQSIAAAVVATGNGNGKCKQPGNLFRSGQSAEKQGPPDARQEGSESVYQHQSPLSLVSAGDSLRSPKVIAFITCTRTSSESHHSTSTCLNINPDDCTVRKKVSDIAPISSVHSGVNQSPSAGLGKQSSSFERLSQTFLKPRTEITENHRPLSAPSYSRTFLDTAITDNASSVSGNLNRKSLPFLLSTHDLLVPLPAVVQTEAKVDAKSLLQLDVVFRRRKHIRSLSEGSYQLLLVSDMAPNTHFTYKPVRGSFADSLRSGKYGRPTTIASPTEAPVTYTLAQKHQTPAHKSHVQGQGSSAKERANDAPPHESRALAKESHATPHGTYASVGESRALAEGNHTPAQESHIPVQKSHAQAQKGHVPERTSHAQEQKIDAAAQKNHAPAQGSLAPEREDHAPNENADIEPTLQKLTSSSDATSASLNGPKPSKLLSTDPAAASVPSKSIAPVNSVETLETKTADDLDTKKTEVNISDNNHALPVPAKSTSSLLTENATSRNQTVRAEPRAEKSKFTPYLPPHMRALQSDKPAVLKENAPKSNTTTTRSNATSAESKVGGAKNKTETYLEKGKAKKIETVLPKSDSRKLTQAKADLKPAATSENLGHSKKKSDSQVHWDERTELESHAPKLGIETATHQKPEAAVASGTIDDSKKKPDTSTKKTDDSQKKIDDPTEKTDPAIKKLADAHDLKPKVTEATKAKVEPEPSTTSKNQEVPNKTLSTIDLQDIQTQVSPQKASYSHALKQGSTNGIDTAQSSKSSQPVQKDPEEIFVPPPKSRVPREPVYYSSIEDQLPEHLRNLPRPVLMGPVVKRNAELAALKPKIDTGELIQRVIQRNEASYKPVVELQPGTQLALELASNESTRPAFLAADQAKLNDEDELGAPTVLSAAQKAFLETRWRYFNNIKDSDSGKNEPKETLNHELVDWDGKWMPVTLEWDTRRQFNYNNKAHIRYLDNWVTQRVADALSAPYKVDVTDAEWRSGALPASGTRKQYQVYPPDCIMRRVPLEYGPVDWSLTPTEKPNDPYSHTPERANQTSRRSARKFHKEYLAKARARDLEKYERRLEIQEFNRQKERSRLEVAPKANIYLRPVQATDVNQLAQIYNYYVRTSVQALEHEDTDLADWQDRVKAAKDETLAFMVAVLKSNKVNGHTNNKHGRGNQRGGPWNQRRREPAPEVFGEMIVGFAYAEDHAGKPTMYHYVAELQVFVDPNHLRQGIGRTLMDRMMESLDKAYHSYGGTDFIKPLGGQAYDVGGSRDIHKILITVGFHYGQEKEFEWRKKWLEMVWDFDHMVTLPCFGNKFGKGVNIAHFVKETNQQNGCSTWYHDEPHRIPHWERAIRAKEKENQAAKEKEEQAANAREEAIALQEELRSENSEYDNDQW